MRVGQCQYEMSIKIKRERNKKEEKIIKLVPYIITRGLNYINFNFQLYTFFFLSWDEQSGNSANVTIKKNINFLTKILWMSRFQSVSNAAELQCTNVTKILIPLNRSTPRNKNEFY